MGCPGRLVVGAGNHGPRVRVIAAALLPPQPLLLLVVLVAAAAVVAVKNGFRFLFQYITPIYYIVVSIVFFFVIPMYPLESE